MKMVSVTDFLVRRTARNGYNVCISLPSGLVEIASNVSEEEADRIELAISQAMIEYRIQRDHDEAELRSHA